MQHPTPLSVTRYPVTVASPLALTFWRLAELPEKFKFIADGYSAYPLAVMEFAKKLGKNFTFKVTQVIGLSNDDAILPGTVRPSRCSSGSATPTRLPAAIQTALTASQHRWD